MVYHSTIFHIAMLIDVVEAAREKARKLILEDKDSLNHDAFYRYRTKYDNFHSDENRNNEDF